MERYKVNHPLVSNNNIELELSSFFKGPRLLQNGEPLKGKGNKYLLDNGASGSIEIKMTHIFVDPFPLITVNGEKVQVVPALRTWEYGWIALPMAMVAFGGAIGGFLGACAVMVNGRIFREEMPKYQQYLFSGLTTFGAVIALFMIATVIGMIFGSR